MKCSLSPLAGREPEGHLFKQLLTRLQFYAGFEINDHTGTSLTDHEMMEIHYQKITSVQVCRLDGMDIVLLLFYECVYLFDLFVSFIHSFIHSLL